MIKFSRYSFLFILGLLLSFDLQAQTQEYADFYDNDQTIPRSKGVYERGVEQGEWLFWHPNGKLQEEANYERGMLNGRVTRYYDNGQKSEEGYFKMDIQDSLMTTWYRDGKMISNGYYLRGEEFDTWTYYGRDEVRYLEESYDSGGTKYVLFLRMTFSA